MEEGTMTRKWHVAGLITSAVSTAFVQYAASGGAEPWALRVAAALSLVAALVTNLGRAINGEQK
jgi:hypothetical protein